MQIQNNQVLSNNLNHMLTSGAMSKIEAAGINKAAVAADMVSVVDAWSSGDGKAAASKTGSVIGTTGGTALGAAIGSFLFPGVGTAVGGFLGGFIGDLTGTTIADKIYKNTA